MTHYMISTKQSFGHRISQASNESVTSCERVGRLLIPPNSVWKWICCVGSVVAWRNNRPIPFNKFSHHIRGLHCLKSAAHKGMVKFLDTELKIIVRQGSTVLVLNSMFSSFPL